MKAQAAGVTPRQNEARPLPQPQLPSREGLWFWFRVCSEDDSVCKGKNNVEGGGNVHDFNLTSLARQMDTCLPEHFFKDGQGVTSHSSVRKLACTLRSKSQLRLSTRCGFSAVVKEGI